MNGNESPEQWRRQPSPAFLPNPPFLDIIQVKYPITFSNRLIFSENTSFGNGLENSKWLTKQRNPEGDLQSV